MTYNSLNSEELKNVMDLQGEIVKRENIMRDMETEIAAQKAKLGEYIWSEHDKGKTFDEGAEQIIGEIASRRATIDSILSDISAMQNENERRREEIQRLAEEAKRKQEEAAAALAAANAMKNMTSNVESSGVVCKKCGSILFKDAKFCAECGTPVQREEPKPQANVCAKCGVKLEEGARFCADCGSPVSVVQPVVVPVMRVCSKCGAKLENDARFCAECGTPA